MVHVAITQLAPGEDKEENLATVEGLLATAAERHAHVAVLPEYAMFTADRTDYRFVASAEPLDGAFVSGLARTARRHRLWVVAGVNEDIGEPDHFSNTLVAMDPTGRIAAVYRKLHLYDAFGFTESAVVRPGEITEPETFQVAGLSFGMQTCYDLRFPESTRRIVDAGADVVLLPAAWVPGPLKEDHWRTLLRARAIENTGYVVAACQTAPMGVGNSAIIDPMGVAVTALGESPGVSVTEISEERIAQVRTKNPALDLRRFAVVPRFSSDTGQAAAFPRND